MVLKLNTVVLYGITIDSSAKERPGKILTKKELLKSMEQTMQLQQLWNTVNRAATKEMENVQV